MCRWLYDGVFGAICDSEAKPVNVTDIYSLSGVLTALVSVEGHMGPIAKYASGVHGASRLHNAGYGFGLHVKLIRVAIYSVDC
jgi:hypothetical protein